MCSTSSGDLAPQVVAGPVAFLVGDSSGKVVTFFALRAFLGAVSAACEVNVILSSTCENLRPDVQQTYIFCVPSACCVQANPNRVATTFDDVRCKTLICGWPASVLAR
jgi:hypothetical protein